ncbi:hypothetical protein, partial [Pseudomonas syringae]|uniref:hypothetical protein n=1 Tax=Pseudomonas syringae TaxID=317 RepID=UPI001E5F6728
TTICDLRLRAAIGYGLFNSANRYIAIHPKPRLGGVFHWAKYKETRANVERLPMRTVQEAAGSHG